MTISEYIDRLRNSGATIAALDIEIASYGSATEAAAERVSSVIAANDREGWAWDHTIESADLEALGADRDYRTVMDRISTILD